MASLAAPWHRSLIRCCLAAAPAHSSSLLVLSRGFGNARKKKGKQEELVAAEPPAIAALIDGDQLGPNSLAPMLAALSRHGQVPVRRFYSNEHRAALWREDLERHNIEPVVVPRKVGGTKDINDLAIAIDAAELVLAPTRNVNGSAVSGIAVVSNDSDFAPLLRRVRGWGAEAYIAALATRGRVPSGLSDVYESAGVCVVPYSLEEKIERHTVTCGFFQMGSFTTRELPPEIAEKPCLEHGELVGLLSSLGYLPGDARGVSMDALVKMFHVNSLGPCMISPLGLSHAYDVIKGAANREFLRDPGNLVLLDRITSVGKCTSERQLRAGGPVLLTVGPALVSQVLFSLGFAAKDEGLDARELEVALAAFCKRNKPELKQHQLSLEKLRLEESLRSLHACFAAQHKRQRWRIMRKA